MLLTLLLKNPAARDEGLEMQVHSNITVATLKLDIQRAYSSHPPVEEQKLIFAGKLLRDDQVLDEIFSQVRRLFRIVLLALLHATGIELLSSVFARRCSKIRRNCKCSISCCAPWNHPPPHQRPRKKRRAPSGCRPPPRRRRISPQMGRAPTLRGFSSSSRSSSSKPNICGCIRHAVCVRSFSVRGPLWKVVHVHPRTRSRSRH